MMAALDRQSQMAERHVVRSAFASDVLPLTRIELLLETVAHVEASNKTQRRLRPRLSLGNLAAEVGGSEPLLTKRADEALGTFSEAIREALTEAKRRGDVARTLDVRKAADAISWHSSRA